MKNKIKRVVFTGGPCSGKTTLLENLALRGFVIIPETARIIIEQEQKKDSDCLPWMDLYGFQKRVARVQREQEHSYQAGLLLQDRGIIDGHGFSVEGKVETPQIIHKVGRNCYDLVLLLNPVPNYKTDNSRKESPEMARRIHQQLERAYQDFGYCVHRIPVIQHKDISTAVAKRADYVINLLERSGI